MRWIIVLALLSGCAARTPGPNHDEAELAQELQGRTEGAASDCVSVTPGRSLDIVSQDMLAYREGRTIWVNRIPGGCGGMRPFDTLVIEPFSPGRYCRGDRVRAMQPGTSIPGPFCRLGNFTPYRSPG